MLAVVELGDITLQDADTQNKQHLLFIMFLGLPSFRKLKYITYNITKFFRQMTNLFNGKKYGPKVVAATTPVVTTQEVTTTTPETNVPLASQRVLTGKEVDEQYDKLNEDMSQVEYNLMVQKQEASEKKSIDKCEAEKKVLYEYFTFPKRLQIKYKSPLVQEVKNLPSTGYFNRTSTTDRIKNYVEDKDSVYSKIKLKINSPSISSVDIYDERGQQVRSPDKYQNVTENWYFLVTLLDEPVLRGGGRTLKRRQTKRPKKKGRRHTKSHYSKK